MLNIEIVETMFDAIEVEYVRKVNSPIFNNDDRDRVIKKVVSIINKHWPIKTIEDYLETE